MKNKFIAGVLCITFSALHTCYGADNGLVSDGPQLSSCQKLSNCVSMAISGKPQLSSAQKLRILFATSTAIFGTVAILGVVSIPHEEYASKIPLFVTGGVSFLASACTAGAIICDRDASHHSSLQKMMVSLAACATIAGGAYIAGGVSTPPDEYGSQIQWFVGGGTFLLTSCCIIREIIRARPNAGVLYA